MTNNWHIEMMDVLDWSGNYIGPKFQAMLCDPPYELRFMGKGWDASGISFQPETWAALAQHLHPGAWIMAFASSRGWHRLACAIEDAGLVIQPTIFGWATGQSFPKATRIDTQIDKRAGKLEDREVIGPSGRHSGGISDKYAQDDWTHQNAATMGMYVTAPATELARAWVGHRYGGQVLKNALEPIICAQVPWTGKRLDCIVETGAGTLWIEGARISHHGLIEQHNTPSKSGLGKRGIYGESSREQGADSPTRYHNSGRWPSNFCLQHDPGCQMQCVPMCPVRRLGEQSGESVSKRSWRGISGRHDVASPETQRLKPYSNSVRGHDDTGTAARFFHQSDWSYEIAERLALADPVHYAPKAARTEREVGLQMFPCLQCGETDSEVHVVDTETDEKVPAHLAGSNGLPTLDEIRETAKRIKREKTGNARWVIRLCRRNDHPTIKSISLNIWLATLLLPPPEYAPRRLLVPFGGTNSEGIGGLLAGWDEVVMIDNNAGYCEIAEARTRWWAGWSKQANTIEPKAILRVYKRSEEKAKEK